MKEDAENGVKGGGGKREGKEIEGEGKNRVQVRGDNHFKLHFSFNFYTGVFDVVIFSLDVACQTGLLCS